MLTLSACFSAQTRSRFRSHAMLADLFMFFFTFVVVRFVQRFVCLNLQLIIDIVSLICALLQLFSFFVCYWFCYLLFSDKIIQLKSKIYDYEI